MEYKPHNAAYKLIGKTIFTHSPKTHHIEFVYGINNEGENEGLEIFFYKEGLHRGHYYSKRYLTNQIPGKYIRIFSELQSHLPGVKAGYKLTLN